MIWIIILFNKLQTKRKKGHQTFRNVNSQTPKKKNSRNIISPGEKKSGETGDRMIFLLQAAAVSAGLSMINAAPALATWGEGSEPGQNIDPAGRPQEFLR